MSGKGDEDSIEKSEKEGDGDDPPLDPDPPPSLFERALTFWFSGDLKNDDEGNEVFQIQKKASAKPMLLSACLSLIPGLSNGFAMGFSAPAMEHFSSKEHSPLRGGHLTENEGSWFVSILVAAILCGNMISGLLADLLGRKRTLVLSATMLTTGWVGMALTDDFTVVLLARVISGLGAGVGDPTSYLMLSEISLIRHRGVFGVCNILAMNVSWTAGIVLFSLLPFYTAVVFCSIPSASLIVLSRFMSESPVWQVRRGQVNRARKTLTRLRGEDYQVDVELKEIKQCISSEQQREQNKQGGVVKRGLAGVLEEALHMLRDDAVRRPLFVLTFMFVFQVLSGAEVIYYYNLDILRRASLPGVNRHLVACIMQATFVFAYVVSLPFMARWPRRQLYVVSGVGMAASNAALGLCCMQASSSEAADLFRLYVACLSLVGVCFFYGFGVGPVCFSLIGELFPVADKARCSAVVMALRYVTSFLVLKAFPAWANLATLSGAFFSYSVCALAGSAFVLAFLPETQGLTLTQLSKIFVNDDAGTEDVKQGAGGKAKLIGNGSTIKSPDDVEKGADDDDAVES